MRACFCAAMVRAGLPRDVFVFIYKMHIHNLLFRLALDVMGFVRNAGQRLPCREITHCPDGIRLERTWQAPPGQFA
jgi:hypothetical protein